jgi:hypothetical protein
MAIKAPKGTCRLCKSKYTGPGMTKHLHSCLPKSIQSELKEQKLKSQPFFHIHVKGYHSPEYWLHLKVYQVRGSGPVFKGYMAGVLRAYERISIRKG